jgi:T5SS/PEP-CTERM-associated repeat protein
MKTKFIIASFALLALAWPNQSRAQYTGNNQTNIISGVTSNWPGTYYVGSNYVYDALLILNGGVLNAGGFIGYTAAAKSNAVVVSGNGSVWTNGGALAVGYSGAGNTLEISNGGKVASGGAMSAIGYNNTASNNSVLVTGDGSAWSLSNTLGTSLYVGYLGASNSLVISAGASVVNSNGTIGYPFSGPPGGNGNKVLVTGSGSVWTNLGFLHVGDYSGNANSLVISNGARVVSVAGAIGYSYGSSNSVTVTGSGSVWSNNLNLVIGRGSSYGNSLVISNGGQVLVDSGSGVGANSNNSVCVTGNDSLWSTRLDLNISGTANSLVVSNGGKVINNSGVVGEYSYSNNSVLVTGSGSVWTNSGGLYVGNMTSGNSLVISNGGKVFNGAFAAVSAVGYNDLNGNDSISASNNSVVVTGAGSLWQINGSQFYLGRNGSGDSLTIRDGGAVVNLDGYVGGGFFSGGPSTSNNIVLVTGSGSLWSNRSSLHFGAAYEGNSLVISNGGTVFSGFYGYISSGSVLVTGTGSVMSNSNQILLGTANLMISNGGSVLARDFIYQFAVSSPQSALTIADGTLLAESLVLTNSIAGLFPGQMTFNAGTLATSQTIMYNSQPFVVGDGTNSATFHLLGGVHSFNAGLRICTNSFLTGCGTINGDLSVDVGGTVLASGCGALTFTGNVTNNGLMIADSGSVLESTNVLVNNGKILLFNGGTTNFTGTFINNGMVVDGGMVFLNPQRLNNLLVLSWTNAGFSLQTAPDLSATFTNLPGATSPYTNPATALQQFFRLKLN